MAATVEREEIERQEVDRIIGARHHASLADWGVGGAEAAMVSDHEDIQGLEQGSDQSGAKD